MNVYDVREEDEPRLCSCGGHYVGAPCPYEHVRCPACGDVYQRIDWGCAIHAAMHRRRGLPSLESAGQPEKIIVACPDCSGTGRETCPAFYEPSYEYDPEMETGVAVEPVLAVCERHGDRRTFRERRARRWRLFFREEDEHACCRCEGDGRIEVDRGEESL